MVSPQGHSGVTATSELELIWHLKPHKGFLVVSTTTEIRFWCSSSLPSWASPWSQGIIIKFQTVEIIPLVLFHFGPSDTPSALSLFKGLSGNNEGKILLEVLPFHVVSSPKQTAIPTVALLTQKRKKKVKLKRKSFPVMSPGEGGSLPLSQTLPTPLWLFSVFFYWFFFTSLLIDIEAFSWEVPQHKITAERHQNSQMVPMAGKQHCQPESWNVLGELVWSWQLPTGGSSSSPSIVFSLHSPPSPAIFNTDIEKGKKNNRLGFYMGALGKKTKEFYLHKTHKFINKAIERDAELLSTNLSPGGR